MLLAIPFDPDTLLDPVFFPCHALIAIGLEEELIDPQEVRWYFHTPSTNQWQLHDLRRRYWKLRDAPHLWEIKRFPCLDNIRASLELNIQHGTWLDGQRHLATGLEDTTILYDWKMEVDKLNQIYCYAQDMTSPYYYVQTRRTSMKDLRELIGEDAFNKGLLPPPVPLHRFREIK